MHSQFDIKRRFIIRLGKALHQFGTPTYRLEAHLQKVAENLELQGSFLVNPTSLTFVLWEPVSDPDEQPQESIHIARVKPGDLDLGRLAATNQMVNELANGEITALQALRRLREIQFSPPTYPAWLEAIGFIFSGGAFAMLMSSNWATVLWSAILSIISYILMLASTRSQRLSHALEPAVAMACAFLAMAASAYFPNINVSVAVISAIIIFIPGLSLTVALSELAARELMSGSARLMDSIMVLFKLYFGAVMGMTLGAEVWGQAIHPISTPLPAWLAWCAVIVLSSALTVIFRMRQKDMIWGILGGAIAFYSTAQGNYYLGESLGPFMGAFSIGIYAALYGRVAKAPSTVVLMPGMVLLVPGSKAYISLNSLILGEAIVNVPNLGSQTFMIFMSLVAGLVFSNLVIAPRSSL